MSLVLLTGLLSNGNLWRHQTSHLSEIASIQVISTAQESGQKMVESILKEAPPTFALAGHSMGGWLCLEIMRTAPSRVTKLCLLNTTARSDSQEKKQRRQQMIQQAEQGHFPDVVQTLVDRLVYNSLVKQDVQKMFLEVGQEAFVYQQRAMVAREETQSVLATIDCPTLVIHAAQDKNFSAEEHQELVNGIRGAKLAVIEDCGHMSPLEMPQAVTALLELWLKDGR